MSQFAIREVRFDSVDSGVMNHASIKDIARKGVEDIKRKIYWPVLSSLMGADTDVLTNDICVRDLYRDAEISARSIYAELGERNPDVIARYGQPDPYDANNDQKAYIQATAELVIYLVDKKQKYEKPQFMVPLVYVVVKKVIRADLAVLVVNDLLNDRDKKFLNCNPRGVYMVYGMFKNMLKDFMPKTFEVLNKIGALHDDYLKLMFRDFFVELLPEPVIDRIVDAYLLEGVKILFRYAMALMKGFKKVVKDGAYKSGLEFWTAVKLTGTAAGGFLATKFLGLPEHLPLPPAADQRALALPDGMQNLQAIHDLAYESAASALYNNRVAIGPIVSRERMTRNRDAVQQSVPKDLAAYQWDAAPTAYAPIERRGGGDASPAAAGGSQSPYRDDGRGQQSQQASPAPGSYQSSPVASPSAAPPPAPVAAPTNLLDFD